jgi:serine/threonine protein kinase/tetratricopeptide (TPR) repeat protein
MSERLHADQDYSVDPDRPQPPRPAFVDARSRKRELLSELSAAWEQGRPVRVEDILPRWPALPSSDADVASLVFEEYQQRTKRGDDDSLSDLGERFPEHRDSLASLIRAHDLLQSVGGSSKSGPRLALPSVGDELFGFRMRHELGRGAFARVFMAEQADLAGRPVVLKVSALEGNEPQTLAQLQHTHIVPIYSVHDNAAAGLRAVCMPYFGGASLSAVLHKVWAETSRPARGAQVIDALESVQAPKWEPVRRAGDDSPPFNPRGTLALHSVGAQPVPIAWLRGTTYTRAAARLIAQLAEGLDHAHERGIYHRDVKPSNILLAADGTPMLLDFNLSEDLNSAQARASATFGGTVTYMSPEHLRAMAARDPILARKVDGRSDIYALGMVLYEMLVGQSPFKQSASYTPNPTLIDAMAVERSESSPSLRRRRPDAPWDLESIVHKCLDPNPEKRYQRAANLAADLNAYLNDLPLRYAPQLSRVERLRKWLRRHPRVTSSGTVATVAAVLLLTAGAALLGVHNHLRSAETRIEANTAHDKLQKHDAGTLRALCLVNVADAHDENLREGAEVCAKTLNLLGDLDGADWANDRTWRHLTATERRRLAENTRELLLLLAWARVRGAPDDTSVLRDALALVQRAEAIPGLEPTPALLEERALYLEKLGDRDAAEAARAEAKGLSPATARDYYLLATTHVRAGRSEQALQALSEALALNPKHYWSWVQEGLIYLGRRDYARALADFSACTGLDPDFAWGWFNRAYVLNQIGDKAGAVKSYTAAIRCDAGFAMAYQNRATLGLELGQHREALADLDRAIELGRDEAAVHGSRASALEALGRYDEAKRELERALTKAVAEKPSTGEEPPALRIRWTYAFKVSDPERFTLARRLFDEVLERAPGRRHAQASYGLARLETLEGHNTRSLPHFGRALEADPNFTQARCFRAVVLARIGEYDKAYADIQVCLQAEPTSGPVLYGAACVASHFAAAYQATNPAASRKAVAESVAFLQRASAAGYSHDRTADDPDLAFLRMQPDFDEFRRK